MSIFEPQVWKESKVFVDSFAGAKTESGDLIQSNCDVEDELGGFINKGRYQTKTRKCPLCVYLLAKDSPYSENDPEYIFVITEAYAKNFV